MSPAHSQDIMIGSENEDSVLTGEIVDIRIERLSLNIGEGKIVEVDTDDLDLEDDYIENYFSVGTTVRITGKFDDQVLEAEEIIRISTKDDTVIIDAD